jgi:hypothetical protein
MIYKTRSPLPGHVRVVFELPSFVWADRIYLVGDFNGWNEQATPMQQDRDGVWRAAVDLRSGAQVQFRYLIDGQWRTDYHADGYSQNGFGTENSLVRAELPAESVLAERLSSGVQDGIQRALTKTNAQVSPLKTARLPRRNAPMRAAA